MLTNTRFAIRSNLLPTVNLGFGAAAEVLCASGRSDEGYPSEIKSVERNGTGGLR
jgi:hypothetical protein